MSDPAACVPDIQATVVGSYPVPPWLTVAPSGEALLDATRSVFQIQELAGLDVVADGELYRWDPWHPDTNGMIDYFVRPLDGVRSEVGLADEQAFRRQQGMGFRAAPAGVVTGEIGPGTLNLPRDCARARSCTDRTMKFTVTGPHMLCRTLLDRHYADRPALCNALGAVLADQVAACEADVIQLDEANITGHPEDSAWAADAINRVFDAAGSRRKGLHLCFGNYGGQVIQQGTWSALIDYMNAIHCDHVLLEFALRGHDELPRLRDDLEPRIGIGLGVIDVKTNRVETPEDVARQIASAVGILGPDRVTWVCPDCGFWMNKRSIADRKIAALVQGRDLFLGRG